MFIATESFTANLTGGDTHVEAGVTYVRETDELYVRYADKFRRAPVERPDVEQATASPGERRGNAVPGSGSTPGRAHPGFTRG